MTRTRSLAGLLVTGLLLAGCSVAGDDADDAHGDFSQVALLTELDPADEAAVGEAVNAFGFDLFGQVVDGDDNVVTSPVSAAMLLAMVMAGARGDTADAMAGALRLDDPRDVRVGQLQDRLADTDEVTLSAGNALWGAPDVPFHDDYQQFARDTFGATMDITDLADSAVVDVVDSWVADQTDGRIDALAEELGLPDPEAALVLVNTVYFLGEWTTRFDPDDTVERPFQLGDGTEASVPLMHLREQEFGHTERDGYQLLRLPYGDDGRYGMELLLPDAPDGLPALVETLDADEWRDAVAALTDQEIDELALPRFTLEWDGVLDDALVAMGMAPVFDPDVADLTAMSDFEDLYLNRVVQKTFLQVDEEGTEAAAATGGSVGITSLEPETRFIVDRPFAFTISDRDTGTVLFLGAVHDPRG